MKRLIYKLKEIPVASETFIVSHIALAIKEGFAVQIIPNKLHPVHTSSQEELIKEVRLLEKIRLYSSPSNKPKRIKEVIFLFMKKPLWIYYFLKLCVIYKKYTWEYLFYLKFYKEYTSEDVFHVHFSKAVAPLLYLKKIGFLKSKIVITFHGYDAYALPEGTKLSKLVQDYTAHVHAITSNSIFLKNQLVDKGFSPNAITVVPVGIDTSYFKNQRDFNRTETKFRIISVGRLIPLKGHLYGIKTIKKLVERGHNVQYTIVGYGDLMDTLKETIESLQLEKYIFLLGLQTQEEIKVLLAKSDVFLMTSTYNKKNRREALGIVSLEAQASGIPVVGFESGGFPETIHQNETGFIVPDRDIDAMTEAVERLIHNDDLLITMKKKSIDHVKKYFDIKEVAKDYFKLYN